MWLPSCASCTDDLGESAKITNGRHVRIGQKFQIGAGVCYDFYHRRAGVHCRGFHKRAGVWLPLVQFR